MLRASKSFFARNRYVVRWADCDANAHMRHTAYIDYGAQERTASLAAALRPGNPESAVLFKEDTVYIKEMFMHEPFFVDTELVGVSADKRKWAVRHYIVRESDGATTCTILAHGAFFDKNKRSIVPATGIFEEWLNSLPRAEEVIPDYNGPPRVQLRSPSERGLIAS